MGIKQAVFRADASAAVGAGHVMRCLTLAQALEAAGWQCAFACRRETMTQVPVLNDVGIDVLEFDDDAAESECLRRRWPRSPDLMVVDHYGLDARFERGCRGWADRILAIDDLANRVHDADLLLDQTEDRRADAYEDFVPAHCRLLLGAEFALLRPEFAVARDAALARRRNCPPLQRVLVAVGTSDPTNFTAVALDGIAACSLDVEVDVVLGSGAPHLGVVRERIAGLSLPVRLHVDIRAAALAEIMGHADVAIGSGGIASWERCCLGLPTLAVGLAENQRLVLDNLVHAGAVELLGWSTEVDRDRIASALRRIAADPQSLLGMAVKASEICDGRGAGRVVQALTSVDG